MISRYWIPVGLVFAAYMAWVFALTLEAADDIRMAAVFSLDEQAAALVVQKLVRQGITTAPPFKYGGLFYYIPTLVLSAVGMVWPVSEKAMLVVMRGVGGAAGLGCLWMTFRIGRSVFGPPVGMIACGILATLPVVLRWSVEAHPDLLQLFWMLCALYLCCRLAEAFSVWDVASASLFAGLAFGTKYGGIFLLPVIGVGVVLATKQHPPVNALRRAFSGSHLRALVAVPAVFAVAFVAVNPHAALDVAGFWRQLAFEKSIMSFGHHLAVEDSALTWVAMLPGMMGWGHGIALLAVAGSGIAAVLRGQLPTRAQALLLLWVAIYLAYLMIAVKTRYPRHLLPVLPVVMLLVGKGYCILAEWISRPTRIPAVVLGGGLVLLGSIYPVKSAAALYVEKKGRAERSVEVVAGRWLAGQFTGDETVLYDAYAYIPTKFAREFVVTPAHTFPIVNHFEPDLLVLRDAAFAHFQNLRDADRARVGSEMFWDIHYFYTYIRAGLIPDYERVGDFEGVSIYHRIVPKVQTDNFERRKALIYLGRVYGVARAREVMGDVHFSQENWFQAVREYALGLKVVPDDPALHYKLGRAYVASGDLQKGQQAFRDAIDRIGDISESEWAEIYLDIAQSFFAASFYAEALAHLQTARGLNDGLAAAAFDIAACRLALGDTLGARSAYAAAVARFGADSMAVDKLRVLQKRGIYSGVVQGVLQTYFAIK